MKNLAARPMMMAAVEFYIPLRVPRGLGVQVGTLGTLASCCEEVATSTARITLCMSSASCLNQLANFCNCSLFTTNGSSIWTAIFSRLRNTSAMKPTVSGTMKSGCPSQNVPLLKSVNVLMSANGSSVSQTSRNRSRERVYATGIGERSSCSQSASSRPAPTSRHWSMSLRWNTVRCGKLVDLPGQERVHLRGRQRRARRPAEPAVEHRLRGGALPAGALGQVLRHQVRGEEPAVVRDDRSMILSTSAAGLRICPSVHVSSCRMRLDSSPVIFCTDLHPDTYRRYELLVRKTSSRPSSGEVNSKGSTGSSNSTSLVLLAAM
ncbi:unnamed protein product [Prorocentrum cordatum]|uniref:Uncharacterized protein n=1 Tax=Prorocentrum cordatum TaxID=2364126 RepID=A0ABN9WB73_9DINO|nr:unnamed protein product [Polarella glacialis]